MKLYKFQFEIRSSGDSIGFRKIVVRAHNQGKGREKAREIMETYVEDVYPGAWVRLDKTLRNNFGAIPDIGTPY